MTLFFATAFLASLVASVAAALVVAPLVEKPWATKFSAGLGGMALTALMVLGVLLNVDIGQFPTSRDWVTMFWNSATLTSVTMIFWMPMFLWAFTALLKRRERS